MDRPAGQDSIFVSVRDDGANDNKFKFSIGGYENSILIGETIGKIRNVSNDEFYIRFNRTDDDIYVWIYTDSSFTTLDETLSIINSGLTEPIRYIYGFQSIDSGTDGDIWMSGHVRNLALGNYSAGYEPFGYFITDDYLNDTECDGSSLALMVNASIPAYTDIQVQFSNDNVTWGDWEGIPLDSNMLSGGFETIDLRYLNYTDIFFMFNFSTTDGANTPRLYQARLISTIGGGCAVPGPSVSGGIGIIMLILICTPILFLLGWGLKKR